MRIKMTLYKLTGSTPQPSADQKIVTDTTDEDGRWNTGQTGERSGKFYAKVKRSTFCKGDLSPVVRALP